MVRISRHFITPWWLSPIRNSFKFELRGLYRTVTGTRESEFCRVTVESHVTVTVTCVTSPLCSRGEDRSHIFGSS